MIVEYSEGGDVPLCLAGRYEHPRECFFWSVRRQRETAGGHEKIKTGHHIADKKEHLKTQIVECACFTGHIYTASNARTCAAGGQELEVTSTQTFLWEYRIPRFSTICYTSPTGHSRTTPVHHAAKWGVSYKYNFTPFRDFDSACPSGFEVPSSKFQQT